MRGGREKTAVCCCVQPLVRTNLRVAPFLVAMHIAVSFLDCEAALVV
jgi:hypothetical protein